MIKTSLSITTLCTFLPLILLGCQSKILSNPPPTVITHPEVKKSLDINKPNLSSPLVVMPSVLTKEGYRIAPMGDWVERTRNLTIAKSIKDRWLSQLENFEQFENETGKRKAEWLQQEIMKLGIQWDTKTALLGDDITAHRYEMADGTPPTPGVTLRVIQPCCFIGSVILEKGIVEAMDKGVR